MNRLECIKAAEAIVAGDRYGSPEDNFTTIASMWSNYLTAAKRETVIINPRDVAAMMAQLKLSRIASGIASSDSWVDLVGYAAFGCELDQYRFEEIKDA